MYYKGRFYLSYSDFCEARDCDARNMAEEEAVKNTVCGIADISLENGDTYKIAVCSADSDDIEHEARSVIFQQYDNWYEMKKDIKVQKMSHDDFAKVVGLPIFDFGSDAMRYSRYYKILSASNRQKEKQAELQHAIDKYELDNED